MEKLPENIEELFDRAIEAKIAVDLTKRARDRYKAPRRPALATIQEWNQYVDRLDEYELTLSELDSKHETAHLEWRTIEDIVIEELPNPAKTVTFCYKGHKIAARFSSDLNRYVLDVYEGIDV